MKTNKINAIPFAPPSECLGKTIAKIGICPDHNTCRVVMTDGSMLWVQSVADENLLLKHGLVAKTIPFGERSETLGSSPHMEWSSFSLPNSFIRPRAYRELICCGLVSRADKIKISLSCQGFKSALEEIEIADFISPNLNILNYWVTEYLLLSLVK